MSSGVSRRSVLQAAGIGTALGATGFSLTGCSSSGSSGQNKIGSEGKELAPFPAYVPWTKGPAADLPGTEEGVQAAYLKYPAEPADALAEKPGDGSKVTIWISSWNSSPLPRGRNKFWQAAEKALGVELDVTVVPAMEYSKKLAALMASGEMPDIMQLVATPNEAQFVPAKCQDLSEFIAGDAVKKYPYLANIPTYAWKSSGRYAGKIYGIPVERPLAGHGHIVNKAKFKEAGLLVPEIGGIGVDEFTQGLEQLSQKGKAALGAQKDGGFGFNAWMPAFGTPNVWSVKDGAFVNYIETDEFLAGLEQMVKWQGKRVYRRDALAIDGLQEKTEFLGQKVFSKVNSPIDFKGNVIEAKGRFEIDYALPFKPSNGATPVHWLGGGIYGSGQTVLKKAPKARIEMLLRVLDALGAPFGTKEWELFNYGVEGTHFTRGKDGGPVPAELAVSGGDGPNILPLYYLSAAPSPLYYPDQPTAVKAQHAWQSQVVPIGVKSAHLGLRTDAWASAEEALNRLREDAIKDVVTGRKKLSDWPSIVKNHMNKGGKQAAEQLAKEYAAAQKA
ncbi:extracellular solute-binding protein [Streptomyces sp. YC504]|uniref:Extracellular solute-binding protein n=1 Tax=Streptomyces mesophilus TaxID=1775132 RepID=A0A6G4XB35_9ACTN|nr:extracellular solute-binding protein [Streptomyces mesophilus]NGO74766.1 extracellular solute-binding protein [Streptomyces mesophilus]